MKPLYESFTIQDVEKQTHYEALYKIILDYYRALPGVYRRDRFRIALKDAEELDKRKDDPEALNQYFDAMSQDTNDLCIVYSFLSKYHEPYSTGLFYYPESLEDDVNDMPVLNALADRIWKSLDLDDEILKKTEAYQQYYKINKTQLHNYQTTDVDKYPITDKDWLKVIEEMNKGTKPRVFSQRVYRKPEKAIPYCFAAKALGWDELYNYLKKDLTCYSKIMGGGEFKAYEDKYGDIQIPEHIQNIIDDLKQNDLKGGLSYHAKNGGIKGYVNLPTKIKKYFDENEDILSYEHLPDKLNYNAQIFKLVTTEGVLYCIYNIARTYGTLFFQIKLLTETEYENHVIGGGQIGNNQEEIVLALKYMFPEALKKLKQ